MIMSKSGINIEGKMVCSNNNCTHYLDKRYISLYKNKFSMILAGATIAVVILFTFVGLSYNKHQESIVNSYREYKHEIDSINKNLKCDSTYSLKQQNVLMRIEYQQNSILHQLEMQSDKLSSDFTVLSIWSGVLMLVFLIFSIYSVFKTDELMKQSRADIDKIEENSDKANELLASIQKKVNAAIDEINKEADKESNELKENATRTIAQIRSEFDTAINEKSSEFNDRCSDYMGQLKKLKDAFDVILKLINRNADDASDEKRGQEVK